MRQSQFDNLISLEVTLLLNTPPIAPPLPDVDGLSGNGTGLEVMCPFAYDRDIEREVERDERKIRQVDVMNLMEELLPQPRIRCFPLLFVEGIQGWIAIVLVVLITWEEPGVVGVIAKALRPLGNVKSAGYCSRGR